MFMSWNVPFIRNAMKEWLLAFYVTHSNGSNI